MKKIRIGKLVFVLSIVSSLLLGGTVGVFAASNLQSIRAYLNNEIKIIYNGTEQVLKDSNGNKVVPITYNGTTYVPLRAVSNILGEKVNYENSTKSVILGEYEKKPISLLSLTNTGGTEYSTIIKSNQDLTILNNQYSSGIYWNIWNATASTGQYRQIFFDIGGNYNTLTFSAWSDIDCDVITYDENFKVVDTFTIKANTVNERTINISEIKKLSFGGNAADYMCGTMKILEPTVK